MEFSDRLRQLREEIGLNKQEFAKMIGVSAPALSKYESGNMGVSLDSVKSIAAIFKISPAWLLGWSEDRWATVEVKSRKIPIIGTVKHDEIFNYESCDGLDIVRADKKVDFCFFVKDDLMERVGIKRGSQVFAIKQETADNGDLVCIVEDNIVKVRRYFTHGNGTWLRMETDTPKDMEVSDS